MFLGVELIFLWLIPSISFIGRPVHMIFATILRSSVGVLRHWRILYYTVLLVLSISYCTIFAMCCPETSCDSVHCTVYGLIVSWVLDKGTRSFPHYEYLRAIVRVLCTLYSTSAVRVIRRRSSLRVQCCNVHVRTRTLASCFPTAPPSGSVPSKIAPTRTTRLTVRFVIGACALLFFYEYTSLTGWNSIHALYLRVHVLMYEVCSYSSIHLALTCFFHSFRVGERLWLQHERHSRGSCTRAHRWRCRP